MNKSQVCGAVARTGRRSMFRGSGGLGAISFSARKSVALSRRIPGDRHRFDVAVSEGITDENS